MEHGIRDFFVYDDEYSVWCLFFVRFRGRMWKLIFPLEIAASTI